MNLVLEDRTAALLIEKKEQQEYLLNGFGGVPVTSIMERSESARNRAENSVKLKKIVITTYITVADYVYL